MTRIQEIKGEIERRFNEIGDLMREGEALGYRAELWDSSCPHPWNEIKDDLVVEFTLAAKASH